MQTMHSLVLLIASICWIAWIPASALANGRMERRPISIMPMVPWAPLLAWLSSYAIDGRWIAGVHLALLFVFDAVIVRELWIGRRARPAGTRIGTAGRVLIGIAFAGTLLSVHAMSLLA